MAAPSRQPFGPALKVKCLADAPCASEADTALAAIVDLVCPQVLHTVRTPKARGIESLRKTQARKKTGQTASRNNPGHGGYIRGA